MRGGARSEIRQKVKEWLARHRQKLKLNKNPEGQPLGIQVGQTTQDGGEIMMLDLGYDNAFQGNTELVRGTFVALACRMD